jgi:hypothetical protein
MVKSACTDYLCSYVCSYVCFCATRALTHSLALSLSLSLSLSVALSVSLFLRKHTHTLSLPPSRTHTHTHTLSLSLSLSLSLTHTHTHTHVHSCKDMRCATCDNGNCKCVPIKEKGQTCGDGTHRAPVHSGFECATNKVWYQEVYLSQYQNGVCVEKERNNTFCMKRTHSTWREHILYSLRHRVSVWRKSETWEHLRSWLGGNGTHVPLAQGSVRAEMGLTLRRKWDSLGTRTRQCAS